MSDPMSDPACLTRYMHPAGRHLAATATSVSTGGTAVSSSKGKGQTLAVATNGGTAMAYKNSNQVGAQLSPPPSPSSKPVLCNQKRTRVVPLLQPAAQVALASGPNTVVANSDAGSAQMPPAASPSDAPSANEDFWFTAPACANSPAVSLHSRPQFA